MIELNVIGIKYNKWQRTIWQGKVVPLEIDRSDIPKYEERSVVKIYGKVLGLLPKQQERLPIGSKVFGSLWTSNNYVKIKLVNKPIDWLTSFADNSTKYFSSEFLNSLDDQDYENEDDYTSVRLDKNSTPIRFHEWLLRVGIDENSVNETVVRRYLNFRSWLVEICQSSEDNYGDDEFHKYKEYCIKEEEFIKAQVEADEIFAEWEFENNRIIAEYGDGAWISEEGAVFNDDGEWIGID
jgi:hypothetical protein